MNMKEGDDNAGIATIVAANNHRTGSGGPKHCETYSPIEKAGSGMCTQRSDGKHLPMNQEAAWPCYNDE